MIIIIYILFFFETKRTHIYTPYKRLEGHLTFRYHLFFRNQLPVDIHNIIVHGMVTIYNSYTLPDMVMWTKRSIKSVSNLFAPPPYADTCMHIRSRRVVNSEGSMRINTLIPYISYIIYAYAVNKYWSIRNGYTTYIHVEHVPYYYYYHTIMFFHHLWTYVRDADRWLLAITHTCKRTICTGYYLS